MPLLKGSFNEKTMLNKKAMSPTLFTDAEVSQLSSTEKREVSDQLLKLLSENQVFLNKIQHGQWNFSHFTAEEYGSLVNLLFNCAEKIAAQMKVYNGFVPAYLEIYLGVSEITEELDLQEEDQVVQDILESHARMLNYLTSFFHDNKLLQDSIRGDLVNYLHTTHSHIYQILVDWKERGSE
jgi:hypothetical protein